MSLRRISAIPFVLPHIIKAAHLRDSVDKRHVLHDRYTGIHWIISFIKRWLGFSSSDPLGWTRIEDMPYWAEQSMHLRYKKFCPNCDKRCLHAADLEVQYCGVVTQVL